jgi:arylsulfatase A-like enzyme
MTKTLATIRRTFASYMRFSYPGLIAGILALAYTLAFNVSLSYMGNTADNALDMILGKFFIVLVLTLLKIIAAYIVLFSILGFIFRHAVRGFSGLFHRTITKKNEFILTFAFIVLFIIASLFRDLILYPQIYIDSFYLKNSAYAAFQEFLTNNLSPTVFSVIQYLIIASAFAGVIINNRYIFSKIIITLERFILKRKIISSAITLILFLLWVVPFHSASSQKNILILASDALRPDHMSYYGYSRNTTPNIDALFNKGITALNIYTTIPRTFPSWTSILTSQNPETHGIRNMFPSSATRNKEFVTLASILKDKGYHTAVVSDFAGDIFPRIKLGFSSVCTPTFNAGVMMEQIALKSNLFILPFLTSKPGMFFFPSVREFADFADPSFVTDGIKNEMSTSTNSGKPFFIVSFYSITHFPFSSPYPYYNKFTDRSYGGPSKYLKNRIVSLSAKGAEDKMTQKDIDHVRALYDGCLSGFDDSAGEIIRTLEKRGLLDNTIIVVLSDHGENLYENDNGMGHGEHLRGKYSLKVPFCIYGKDIKPEIISTVRSTIDVAPTILELLKMQKPESFEGCSLLKPLNRDYNSRIETGLWFDTGGDFFFQKKRIMYPDITGISEIEFDYGREIVLNPQFANLSNLAKHRAIIKDKYKLIAMPLDNKVEYSLYDLSNDPQELKNIESTNTFTAEKLKAIMKKNSKINPFISVTSGFTIPRPDPSE